MAVIPSLVALVYQFRLSQYTALVGATVWAFDLLITINDELELLWSRNGPLIKVLYLINRYLPIAGAFLYLSHFFPTKTKTLSIPECQFGFACLVLVQVVQVIVANSIFIMRISVIYWREHSFRRVLWICLFISHVMMFTFYGFAMHNLLPGMVWEKTLRMCLLPYFSTWPVAGLYLTPVFTDSLVFLATLTHAFRYHKQSHSWKNESTASVLNTLYVNGCLYYVIIIHLRLGSILVYFLAPLGYQLLFCYLEYSISSTLTSRWFLSFRRTIINSRSKTDFASIDATTDVDDHNGGVEAGGSVGND